MSKLLWLENISKNKKKNHFCLVFCSLNCNFAKDLSNLRTQKKANPNIYGKDKSTEHGN